MKNFIQSIRGFYATLILMVVLLATTLSATAQSQKPFNNTYEAYSQMWNVSSTTWYFGTIAFTPGSKIPTGANYGRQRDTAFSGADLTLTTSSIIEGEVNDDSAVVQPVPGNGDYTFTAAVYMVDTTATITETLMSSSDGVLWAPVVGATVYTVVPTSATVPVVNKWPISSPTDRMYAVLFTGDASNGYWAQAYYYFQRRYRISLQK